MLDNNLKIKKISFAFQNLSNSYSLNRDRREKKLPLTLKELEHVEEVFESFISDQQDLKSKMKKQVDDFFEKIKSNFISHIDTVLNDVDEIITDFSKIDYLNELINEFQNAKSNFEYEENSLNEQKARFAVETLLSIHKNPIFKFLVDSQKIEKYLQFRKSYFDSVLKKLKSIEIPKYDEFEEMKELLLFDNFMKNSISFVKNDENVLVRLMTQKLKDFNNKKKK